MEENAVVWRYDLVSAVGHVRMMSQPSKCSWWIGDELRRMMKSAANPPFGAPCGTVETGAEEKDRRTAIVVGVSTTGSI